MRWVRLSAAVACLAALGGPVLAAASTTCLCRTDDGKSFRQTTASHHRWACDFKLGYAAQSPKPREPNKARQPNRPATETCSPEEIAQFKVWVCMERGCTYPYVKSNEQPNKGLEKIETIRSPRQP